MWRRQRLGRCVGSSLSCKSGGGTLVTHASWPQSQRRRLSVVSALPACCQSQVPLRRQPRGSKAGVAARDASKVLQWQAADGAPKLRGGVDEAACPLAGLVIRSLLQKVRPHPGAHARTHAHPAIMVAPSPRHRAPPRFQTPALSLPVSPPLAGRRPAAASHCRPVHWHEGGHEALTAAAFPDQRRPSS
jgi:hypothetical protein